MVLREYIARGLQHSLGLEDTSAPAYDEVIDGTSVRPAWSPIVKALQRLTPPRLRTLARRAERLLAEDGVSYNRVEPVSDEADAELRSVPMPWALDVLPLVVGSHEWAAIAAGLDQRARLLDAIVTDLYGERRLLADGSVPASLVLGHSGYLRPAHGLMVPGPHQLIMTATDLGRGSDGSWQVIADRTQAPSGSAYAMENRRVMSRLYPEVHEHVQIERLRPFFQAYRAAVMAAAPRGATSPQAVVLSPGAHSETAFDQGYLASLLGFPLVEGSDLVMRDGKVWMRTLGKLAQVDVIIRRVDADYADPLFLRADSQLGVPGLVDAARRGAVSVINGLGTGVLENPGLMALLPRLCRTLLGEDLLLPSIPTFWCGDEQMRSHVLANLDSLVIRPIDRTRAVSVFAGGLSRSERADVVARVMAEPWAWVGQDLLSLSTTPTLSHGTVVSRPVTLRTFCVAGPTSYTVLRGGVARVPADRGTAPQPGAADSADPIGVGPFLGRQQPTASKDVWVLAAGDVVNPSTGWLHDGPAVSPSDPFLALSPRMLADLFWIGRYSVRSEDLLRLLLSAREVNGDLCAQPTGWSGQGVTVLREAMTQVTTTYPGFLAPGIDACSELRSLMTRADRAGTLAQSVAALREALTGVRDQLSQDVWLVLSVVERTIADLRGVPDDVSAELVNMAERSLVGLLGLSGIVLDNMTHDPGWHLLNAGRAAERSLHVLALLRSTMCLRHTPGVDSLVIDAVLEASESIVTYRRRYRGRAHIEGVLDLLLFDETNPRSVAYQVRSLGEHIPRFATSTEHHAAVQGAYASVASILADQDVVSLASATASGDRPDLHTYLGEVHDAVSALCDVIDSSYLRGPGMQRQMFDSLAASGVIR